MAGAIAQDRESCQFSFVLDEKPTVVPVGSAGERSGGARKAPCGRLARIQSEWRHRLALASGCRLLTSFGINRLTRRGAGRQAQMPEDLDDHWRMFGGGDALQFGRRNCVLN